MITSIQDVKVTSAVVCNKWINTAKWTTLNMATYQVPNKNVTSAVVGNKWINTVILNPKITSHKCCGMQQVDYLECDITQVLWFATSGLLWHPIK